jgi:hypothetical protein
VCDGIRHRRRFAGRSGALHEHCERPFWLQCLCGDRVVSRCGSAARAICGPCSTTYRRRVKRIFESGYSDRPTDRVLLLTVTAPGDEAHRLRDGSLCPCTPIGGVEVAEYNAMASACFNRLVQRLRRTYGANLQYARAAEVQDGKRRRDGRGRGALHFHVLIRSERPAEMLGDFRKKDPNCRLRQIVMAYGFGHEVDLRVAAISRASYCAKYVSKSADERQVMPWLDLRTGEIVQGNGRYRTWTASRRWGLTMRAVRAAQAAWVRAELASDGLEGAGAAGGRQPDEAPVPSAGEAGPLDSNTTSYTIASSE